MSLDPATKNRITQLITGSDVVLFMKGVPEAPQCGFSATVVGILNSYVSEYETVDVLSNPDIRDGIKAYSSWPTIPQLYVNGEFVGGCDIIKEMAASGELFGALGVEPPPEVVPNISVTDSAAEALQQAAAEHGGPSQALHLTVSSDYQSSLSMAPRADMDVEVNANGITLLIDRMSASRSEGITIDVVDTPRGPGFKVDNPNAPQVGQMSVEELKTLRGSGEKFELIDVRTPSERDAAEIAGSMLITEDNHAQLEALPKDTKVVFICHHGPRAQQTAERFIHLGFRDVFNVIGGIDAWSQEIDPSVPRY
jgi:monothiol glutaredoxin